jgi:hypothetical protein
MAKGKTTIGHAQADLRIYVSTREKLGHFGQGILIEQGLHLMIDDVVLVDSEERAQKLIAAIKRRGAELGWTV